MRTISTLHADRRGQHARQRHLEADDLAGLRGHVERRLLAAHADAQHAGVDDAREPRGGRGGCRRGSSPLPRPRLEQPASRASASAATSARRDHFMEAPSRRCGILLPAVSAARQPDTFPYEPAVRARGRRASTSGAWRARWCASRRSRCAATSPAASSRCAGAVRRSRGSPSACARAAAPTKACRALPSRTTRPSRCSRRASRWWRSPSRSARTAGCSTSTRRSRRWCRASARTASRSSARATC